MSEIDLPSRSEVGKVTFPGASGAATGIAISGRQGLFHGGGR